MGPECCQGSGERVALAGAPQDGAVGGCQLQQCHSTGGTREAAWYKGERQTEAGSAQRVGGKSPVNQEIVCCERAFPCLGQMQMIDKIISVKQY